MQYISEMRMVQMREDPQELSVEVYSGLGEGLAKLPPGFCREHRLVPDEFLSPGEYVVGVLWSRYFDLFLLRAGGPGIVLRKNR